MRPLTPLEREAYPLNLVWKTERLAGMGSAKHYAWMQARQLACLGPRYTYVQPASYFMLMVSLQLWADFLAVRGAGPVSTWKASKLTVINCCGKSISTVAVPLGQPVPDVYGVPTMKR